MSLGKTSRTGFKLSLVPINSSIHSENLSNSDKREQWWTNQARFEKLLVKVGLLAPDKKVSCFVTGLKDSIRTDVQANLPSTLTMAIGLARLFEARDTTHRRPTAVTSSRENNTWRRGTGNTGHNSTTTTTPVKKMTADELSERRKKGLCFHYHERYTPGHNCKKSVSDRV